jgi:hypothetical protein
LFILQGQSLPIVQPNGKTLLEELDPLSSLGTDSLGADTTELDELAPLLESGKREVAPDAALPV